MILLASPLSRRVLPALAGLALLVTPTFSHVQVNAPNGSETLCAGTTTTIEWEILIGHNTLDWDLAYSVTGAAGPWIPIVTDLAPGDISTGAVHTFPWTVPDVSSTEVRVRVIQDNFGNGDYLDFSNSDLTIHGEASATFRADAAGVNATGYVATAPLLGTAWTATVDNATTGNTAAGVVGFGTPDDVLYAFGSLLVDVTHPVGELLGLALQTGTGIVSFSLDVPSDLALCGITLSTQAYGVGGPGLRVHNAYDLVVGTF